MNNYVKRLKLFKFKKQTFMEWPLEVNDKHLSLGIDKKLMSILEEERKRRESKRYNEQTSGKN